MLSRCGVDRVGSSTFPLVVVFGVTLGIVMAALFVSVYNWQLDARVADQARILANDLASTAFLSLSGGQPSLPLPLDVGGSDYRIEIVDNNTFTVKIVAGRLSGSEFSSITNALLRVENSDFTPGGRIYFRRAGGVVLVSSSPIAVPADGLEPSPAVTPPEFYHFARENAKAAAAIVASYFFALENHSGIDATGYVYEGKDVLVQIRYKGGDNLFGVRVAGYENTAKVGKVQSAWIVTALTVVDNLTGAFTSPSVENAASSGWLHSPSKVLHHLRGRTWRRTSDNAVVVVPPNAVIRAASATTNVSTYPTWRVEWRADIGYVIYFQALPVWWGDPRPGFVFQSSPELEAVT